MIETLPITKLKLAEDNPRRDPGDISELAESIKAVGIVEPLVVTPAGDGTHLVVAGSRRLAAASAAGLVEVPAIVRNLSDEQRAEIMLVENLQREDLAPLEETAAFRRLIDLGYSQRKLAERIGRSQAHISKRLALEELTPKARTALDSGRITLEEAQDLLKLRGMPKRMDRALGKGSWAVGEELRDHQNAEKQGQLEQQVKAKGHRLVRFQRGGYGDLKLPKGALQVTPDRGFYGPHIRMSPKKHEKEACHAAAIKERSFDGPQLVPVCTDPSRHPKERRSQAGGGGPLSAKEKENRRWKVEHNRGRREAQARREQFMRELLGRRVRQGDALTRLFASLIDHGDERDAKVACLFLDLRPVREKSSWGMTIDSYKAALSAYASKDSGNLERAALAFAFGMTEVPMRTDYPSFEKAKDHLKFLADRGYRISGPERVELKGKAPR